MRTDSTAGRTTTADAGLSPLTLLGAAGVGAALMYFLDPDRGNRRRRLAADRVVHARHVAGDALESAARDLRNRAKGAVALTRSRFAGAEVDDVVLTDRVRSKLGRLVSRPSAITVDVREGRATLSGPVLADEVDQLLSGVRAMRGIHDVENRLAVHQSAENVLGLQGGARHTGGRPGIAQENWPPAMRIVSGGVGGALAFYGARRKDPLGAILGLGGVALAARGLTNVPASRLTGVAAGRRAVEVQKTITIHAPVERVFQFFSQWENWPRWMSHVRDVRTIGAAEDGGRTRWVVDGIPGTTVEWDALTTELVPNEALAWKSASGAAVEHAGTIRFSPTVDGATTVDVKMTYTPPAGGMGHAVAVLFGRDPKRQMDDDLARLKTMIETGIPPHDATRPARSQVALEERPTQASG